MSVLVSLTDRSRYLVESYFEGSGVGVSVLAHEGEILQIFQHRRLREGKGGNSSYRISETVNPAFARLAGKSAPISNIPAFACSSSASSPIATSGSFSRPTHALGFPAAPGVARSGLPEPAL